MKLAMNLRVVGVTLAVFGLIGLLGPAGPVQAEQQTPPEGGEPKDFTLPTLETLTLDNGLQAKLVPFGSIPKAQIRVVIGTGNIDETPEEVWLADLLSQMMEEGAGDLDAAALAEAYAALGGELRISAGVDSFFLWSGCLAESTPDLIRLLAMTLQQPTLPAGELERVQGDLARQLAVRKTRPRSQAERKFWTTLYPGHPYGRELPEAEQVGGYTIDQLRAFHGAQFGAKRTQIYVVGRFDLDAAKAAIEKAFGAWAAGPEPTENVAQPVETDGRRIFLVDRPGAAQSNLRLGLPVVDPSDPDYVTLQVTNALLGGSFASRITANLREDKGYTYSPNSSVSARYRTAVWVQRADVTTDVTGPAIKEIFYEIDRLRSEPPSVEELEGIQNYLSGAFVRTNSNPFGIGFQLYYVDFHGLGADHLTSFVQRVHAVTPEDVQRMVEKYLRNDLMTIVVVGDAAKIKSQLEAFGEVTDL
ncbi:MAG: pitrilysin family protein [Acidobacteriota bacterium]